MKKAQNRINSQDDIYFKDYLKSPHRKKINIIYPLIILFANAGLIVLGFVFFSLAISDSISIKPSAYDENTNKHDFASVSEKDTSPIVYSDLTTSLSTSQIQVFEVTVAQEAIEEKVVNTESTTEIRASEMYGIVNTENDPLNMRLLPSTDSEILTTVPKGATIIIISDDGDWVRARYLNVEGYVFKKYVLFCEDGTDNNYAGQEDSSLNIRNGIVITEKDPLNVRISPSIDSKKIGTVSKGSRISIVSENGDWYEIEYNSGRGFVSKKYVQIQN